MMAAPPRTAGAVRAVTAGPLVVEVRELTFVEVREWFVALDSNQDRDVLHALAFEDCGLDDLARMCNVPAEALEQCTPSELRPVVQAARALNPFFFRVRASISAASRQLLAAATWSTASTETPPG